MSIERHAPPTNNYILWRTMYQCKVDVDTPVDLCSDEVLTLEMSANTLFTAFSISTSTYIDTLYVLPPRRPKLVLTGTSIPLFLWPLPSEVCGNLLKIKIKEAKRSSIYWKGIKLSTKPKEIWRIIFRIIKPVRLNMNNLKKKYFLTRLLSWRMEAGKNLSSYPKLTTKPTRMTMMRPISILPALSNVLRQASTSTDSGQHQLPRARVIQLLPPHCLE